MDKSKLQQFLDANPDAKAEYEDAIATKEAEKEAAVASAVAEAKRTTINEYRYRAFMQEREAIRRLLPTSCRHDTFFFF